MQIKFISILLFSMIGIFLISGWNRSSSLSNNNNSITNFYYYKDAPYELKLNNDKIFIKLKKVISGQEFQSLLGQFSQSFSEPDYKVNEKEQFLKLTNPMSDANLKTFIDRIKSSNVFENVSPVFSMPEGKGNANTLIGVENEIIVQFKQNKTDQEINDFIQNRNLAKVQQLELSGGRSFVYKIPANSFAIDVANNIYENGMVNYSEPNFYFTNLMQYVPNDPLFPRQWSVRNLGNNIPDGVSGTPGCDMRVDSAWNITLGSSTVKVSMVDSGIDSLHEDLAANIVPNSAHDFINNLPYAKDGFGHGTCTSGIVAAVGNNSTGASGIAPQCKLVPVMIFNASGSTSSTAIINGLIYSWQMGWISSNSWGGGSPISAADNAIVDGTVSGRGGKGTVFCFATGNNNAALSWPSTNPNVIAVGGNSPCNQRKSTTSCDGENFWGADYGTGISIVAPCVKVYASDITGGPGSPNGGAHGFSNGNYDSTFNGTSSATPNAAGVCALMLSLDSSLRWDSVRVILCKTADKVGSYSYTSAGPYPVLGNTWNNEMGYGKVNAYNAVRYIYQNLGPIFSVTPLPNTENLTGPYVVNSIITSLFGAIDPAKTKLFWTRTVAYDSVLMTNSGGNIWTANIPGNGAPATYKYYLRAADVTGRVRTYPTDAPNSYLSFLATNDLTPPVIATTPLDNQAKANWPVLVSATATDNLGVDSVWVKWHKNTSAVKEFKLVNTGSSNYSAYFNSVNADVSIGDSIFYRIYAQDNSTAHNRDSTSQYKFKIVNVFLAQGFYSATYPPTDWSLDFSGTQYWTRADVSSYGINIGSSKFDFYTATAGTIQSINTLTFGASSAGDSLKFDHAYATYTGGENDQLQIETSTNGGTSYTVLILLDGGNSGPLVTAPGQSAMFTPTNSQWATKKYSVPAGTNKVRFKAISAFGNNLYLDSIVMLSSVTGISTHLTGLVPETYSLSQNYPNPFNPTTHLGFGISNLGFVSLKVFNALGKEVAVLVNEKLSPGRYEVEFNGSSFASGVYFYQIRSGEFVETKRMILLK